MKTKIKTWMYVACAIFVGLYAGFLVCGLIAFTPLGSIFGRHWHYNGGMGVGRISPFPNQSAIAYSSSHSGTSHIYTVSWGGNLIRQLTNDAGGDSDVCVSPNGKIIVFARQDADGVHLWIMNTDGTGQHQITFGNGCQTEPYFSPGGAKIAYVESAPASGKYAIAIMKANGTNQTLLTNNSAQDTEPVFDPTGTSIYFSRYYQDSSGCSGIWNISIIKKGEHLVGLGNCPAVSPNGKDVAFCDAPQGQTLGIMNANGAGRKIIGQNMGYESCIRYCPDAQHLLILTSEESKGKIWSVRLNGTGLKKINAIE